MDPKELFSSPEQIQNLISLLQTLLPKDEVSSKQETKKKTRNKKKIQEDKIEQQEENSIFNSVIKTKNKRNITPQNINKFEKMSEFSMYKSDSDIDKKLSKQPPVARTRSFEPVYVTCRVCGKKETVSPSLVYEGPARYKCNNCSTNAG